MEQANIGTGNNGIKQTYWYLKDDVRSVVNTGECYGNAGEKVREVADHGNVIIVEGENGIFPVIKEHLIRPGGINLHKK
jgi:hypothetical protein